MKLSIQDQNLVLDFSGWEKFLTFNFKGHFEIPLAHVTGIGFTAPKTSWREARAPGSYVPGLIKAGTFYTPRGKEFWYVTRQRPVTVVVDLQQEKYDRLIIGFPAGDPIQDTLRASRLPMKE
jgi:hypothetical protein